MSPLKKITWVLLGSSSLALVLLIFYLTNTLQGFAVDQWEDNRSQAAIQLSRLIDHELFHAKKRLQFISQQDAFRSIPDPALIDKDVNGIPLGLDSARREILDWLLVEKDQSFNVLFVLMPNGDHYLSHPYSVQQNLITYNLAHRPYFREASKTRQPVISGTFVGADGVPAVAILVPVLDEDGEISSFLGGVFHLAHLTWLVEDFSYGMDHGSIFLLDRTGSPVVESGKSKHDISSTLNTPFVKSFLSLNRSEKPSVGLPYASEVVTPSGGVGPKVVFLSRLECGWTIGLESGLESVSSQFQKPVWRTVGLIALLLLIVGGSTIFTAWNIGLRWQMAHC